MTNKILITAIALLSITLILCGIKACNTEEKPIFHFGNSSSNDAISLENKLKKKDKEYAHIIWQLGKQSDSLQKIIDKNKVELSKAQVKTKQVENRVLNFSKKVKTTSDTLEKLSACDSLQNLSEIFVAEHLQKDSIYNYTISTMEQLVRDKDSSLSFCQSYNDTLSHQLFQQIEEQRKLELSLTQYRKEAQRRKFLTQFLSSAALILSGITAALLIQ